jgi:hypothetical protein
MAIVKKNLFLPGQNLTNMGLNVDLNAFSDDKTYITVNFGTSPATVSVKVGSIIEANGNRYTIESADYSFQMANTTDNYIVFDGTIFKSAATKGTYDTAKQGYYQGGSNTERAIKWFVDQAGESITQIYEFNNNNGVITTELFDRMTLELTGFQSTGGVIQLTSVFDVLNNWDGTTNYRFDVQDSGYYMCTLSISFQYTVSSNITVNMGIRKNSTNQLSKTDQHASSANKARTEIAGGVLIEAQGGDNIDFTGSITGASFNMDTSTRASIFRLF